AFFHRPLPPHAAAMAGDHPAHGRKTNPRALELLRAMQALEHTEKLVRIAHVESGAIVADEHYHPPVLLTGNANLNLRGIAPPRVLHGIADEIAEHLPQHRGVADHGWQRGEFPDDVPVPHRHFQAL